MVETKNWFANASKDNLPRESLGEDQTIARSKQDKVTSVSDFAHR